ncbi:hypothetical protein G4228_019700 [Cervus hanglu yarkandensis]|uniref:Peptidase A1 domain-containing protein n=1 Tax=Cervus hanglu yarkandensis TaxID=84702 RepID=A0A833VSL0_9CERV|nr:hypothetical protein G4228_019700 [Cervus hanglu yarkandensis]
MKGFLAYDTIRIGDLVSIDQRFGLSLELSEFEELPFDGVLGLSYPNMSFLGGIPIFDNLKNQGAISEPVFAFYLSKSKPDGSVVMFGGVDKSYYQGTLNWVPLIQARTWRVHMDRISMNSQTIACFSGCEALMDTGASLIQGPRSLVNNTLTLIGATPRGSKDSSGDCYIGIRENPVSESTETWTLGDVFLRQYFSVYDRGNDRIGLAQAV